MLQIEVAQLTRWPNIKTALGQGLVLAGGRCEPLFTKVGINPLPANHANSRF